MYHAAKQAISGYRR